MPNYKRIPNEDADGDPEAASVSASRPSIGSGGREEEEEALPFRRGLARHASINVTLVLQESWKEVVHVTLTVSGIYTFVLAGTTALVAPNLSLIAEEMDINERGRDMHLAAPHALAFFLPGVPFGALGGYLADK